MIKSTFVIMSCLMVIVFFFLYKLVRKLECHVLKTLVNRFCKISGLENGLGWVCIFYKPSLIRPILLFSTMHTSFKAYN